MDVRTHRAKRRSQLASRGGCRSVLICAAASLLLQGCTTTQKPTVYSSGGVQAGAIAARTPVSMVPVGFSDLPGWRAANLHAARSAFLESCRTWSEKPGDSPVSVSALYGGVTMDWAPACSRLRASELMDETDLHEAFEDAFSPVAFVPTDPASKLTGYFEPVLEVSATPVPGRDTAVPGAPEGLTSRPGANGGGRTYGVLRNGAFTPLPSRADVVEDPSRALAYANAADVFYLQIQGSGRLVFPDGRSRRAAFAAHNGQPFQSIARHLISTGEITPREAGIAGVKAWMDRVGPTRARAAMNVNPRYVWFVEEPISDPSKGPKGAQGVALTPMGSMAVDPLYHPYGAPIFLDTRIPAAPGDWKGKPFQTVVIAQDTGGAIKGPLRGDLFFGWGEDAGARAGSQNYPVGMWVLLPRALAARMAASS